jgi:hypothetical protein
VTDEEPVTRRLRRDVQLVEDRRRHEDLAAHLEHVGHVALRRPSQLVGDGRDGRDVGRHVLADAPVATGGCLGEAAVLVAHAHRHAVDLQLAHEPHGLVAEGAGDPVTPRLQLGSIHRVVEARHRHVVHDGRERGARRAADRLRRRRRRCELRVLVLDPAELAHDQVEVGVADLRTVELVVSTVVVGHLGAQLGESFGGRHRGRV